MRRRLVVLCVVALAALTIAVAPAAADPVNSPNTLHFTVTCPGMDSFQVTVAGAIGFVDGQRLLALRQTSADPPGSVQTVTCTSFSPETGSFTVYLSFVSRG